MLYLRMLSHKIPAQELADGAAGKRGIAPYQFEPQFEEGQAQELILGGEMDRENSDPDPSYTEMPTS